MSNVDRSFVPRFGRTEKLALLLAEARLADGSSVAALRVAGLSLLERALFVARDAGARRALVVAERSAHEELRTALRRSDHGLELFFLDPRSDYSRILLLLARSAPGVLVLRADVAHGRAAAVRLREKGFAAYVDPAARDVRRPERCTLGDDGPAWTGLARVPTSVARDVIDGATQRPDRGDRDALELAVAEGRVEEVEAPELPWQLVEDADDARRANRRLFRSLGKPQDGVVARYLNRPISTAVSRLLADGPVQPNHITAFVFLLGLAGCLLVAFGDPYWLPLLGALVVHIASVLDGCDGELARLRYQQSRLGAWLDTLSDAVSEILFIACVGIYLGRFHFSPLYAAMSIVAVACGTIVLAIVCWYLRKIGSGCSQDFPNGVQRAAAAGTPFARLVGFLAYLVKRDTQNLLMVLCAAVGLLEAALGILFTGATLMAVVFVRRAVLLRRRPEPQPATAALAGVPATAGESAGAPTALVLGTTWKGVPPVPFPATAAAEPQRSTNRAA
jgi:phosphatidylglycerophosphate synthase